eukprot:scaffold133509_cov51-Attheya_sp.AAC.1
MTLAKVAKINEKEMGGNGLTFVASPGAHRMEKVRQEHPELRLDAITALMDNATCTRDTNMSPLPNRKRRVLSRMESQLPFKQVLTSRQWLKFMIRKINNERKKRKLFCGSEKAFAWHFVWTS